MVKSFSRKIAVGDRIQHFGGGRGTLVAINKGLLKYQVNWDNGKTDTFTSKEFSKWCEVCSDSSTSAQVSVLASHSQDFSSENSGSNSSVKKTNGVEASLSLGIQASQFHQMYLLELETVGQDVEEISTSSQVLHPANRSVSKVNDSAPPTSEIVSPESYKRSHPFNPNSSASKMSEDCSPALGAQDSDAGHTSTIFAVTFAPWDSDLSGELSPADILEAPFLESGCSWLESPGALSSDVSRAPGQSRLESSLKQAKHLQNGECINPAFLEDAFTIPLGWSDRLVSRSAIALLEKREKPSEIAWTRESQQLPLSESSTSTALQKSEEELIPTDESAVGKHYWCDRLTVAVTVESVHNWRETPSSPEIIKGARCRPWWIRDKWGNNFAECMVLTLHELVEIEEFSCPFPKIESPITPSYGNNNFSLEKSQTQASKQTGSIYQYTANKPDKIGTIHTYPKVEGERRRDEDSHWYWGFSYVEKVRGKWCDRSCAIPRKKLSLVRAALRDGKPYTYIIQEVLGK